MRSTGCRAAVLALMLLAAVRGMSAQQAAPDPPRPWWERLSFGGDLRVRYEGERGGDRTRDQVRFRLRLSLAAEPIEDLRLAIRLASGDPGNPTSAEQTFTEFWTRKPINIDQLYIVYRPRPLRIVSLATGKFPFPLPRMDLTWDEDVNWEGFYERIAWEPAERLSLAFTAVQSSLNEVVGGPDAFMFVQSGQLRWRLGSHELYAAVADYRFRQIDQVAVATHTGILRTRNTNLLRRSPAGAVVGFASAFHLIDVIASATLATGRPDYPVRIAADVVTNTGAVTDEDTGIWVETEFGRAARPGTIALRYVTARIEQDAVLSPFSFSNIPGSNVRLNMVTFSYMPRPALNLDFEGFLTRRLVVPPGDPNPRLARVHVAGRLRF
jgi:hypothetical protein